MHAPRSNRIPDGFTLIEVLAALALCALLAAVAASAVAFASRAERLARRDGEASLLLPALYAAQRLRPDDLAAPPPGWRVAHETDIVKVTDDLRQEWHRLVLVSDRRDRPALLLQILGDAP